MHAPVEYRSPGTRDGEQAVVVERRSDGSVAVGIHYPRKVRTDMLIGIAITTVLAIGMPILVRVLDAPWQFVAIAACIMVPVCLCILEIFRNVVSAQEWVASAEGLRIVRFEPWGSSPRRFIRRSKIRDVRIRFGRSRRAGGSRCDIWLRGRFLALLPPVPTLSGLGGDQIARVADGLREGLGMPPVDWPSGRPKPRAADPNA